MQDTVWFWNLIDFTKATFRHLMDYDAGATQVKPAGRPLPISILEKQSCLAISGIN
jgi:hypothetical protein